MNKGHEKIEEKTKKQVCHNCLKQKRQEENKNKKETHIGENFSKQKT